MSDDVIDARLTVLESDTEDHEIRLRNAEEKLSNGKAQFATIEEKLTALADVVGSLVITVRWVGFGVVGAVGLALLSKVVQ